MLSGFGVAHTNRAEKTDCPTHVTRAFKHFLDLSILPLTGMLFEPDTVVVTVVTLVSNRTMPPARSTGARRRQRRPYVELLLR